MTRILLVEDHPLVRHGLRALLELAGFLVCGEVDSRADALQALRTTHPDLLMVDLTLWGESGLEVIRDLRLEGRGTKALVYSMHEDWLHVRQAFQAGADGYVTKRDLPEVLLEAIGVILDGGVYTSPRAARAVSAQATRGRLDGLARLSDQESNLFRKLGEGLGVGELAEEMALSRKTVESYCDRLLVKLDLKGMKELRLLAIDCEKHRG